MKKSTTKTLLRRSAVSALALGSAISLFTGCAGGAAPAEVDLGKGPAKVGTVKKDALKGVTLTFVSWGGSFQDGQMQAAGEPFAKESGAKVLSDGPTEYAKVKAQVDSKNVTWDIVDSDSIWAEKQCGENGLLQPIDTKVVDLSETPEQLTGECYVPAMQYGYVIMYNADKYKTAPTGWKDFFDTKNFPGKRAIAGFEDVGPGVYEGALLAEGVPADKLYPLDMDRAYKKLDTIKDDLIFWKTGAESVQMMESGEADMALVWSGRGYEAVKNGANYKPIWNQALVVYEALSVPKHARNSKAAMAFLNYYLGAKQQAKLTELTSYSPVNKNAKPNLDELGQQFLVTNPEIQSQMVDTDTKWWAKVYDSELERWMAWLQG